MGQAPPEEGEGATSCFATTVRVHGPLSFRTNQLIVLVHTCRPYMLIFLLCIFSCLYLQKNLWW